MPEICEVCLTSQYLSSLIGCDIQSIDIISGRYKKKKMVGLNNLQYPLKIIDIDTKGKFMWFVLEHDENKYYMLNTFGLTGKWFIGDIDFDRVRFNIASSKKKYVLNFADIRNFGTIEITDNIDALNKKLNKLAPDLLKTSFTSTDLQNRLNQIKNQNKKIVEVLMSQDKNSIGSGLGNYLVPEILYNAKLSPHRTIKSLSKDDILHLSHAIKYILKWCYTNNATEYISHLQDFIKTRKGFPKYLASTKVPNKPFYFHVYRQKHDKLNNPIIGEKIITGRTTYWCPNVQV
jgi:DNA-formamidopyrimidine glycosylase